MRSKLWLVMAVDHLFDLGGDDVAADELGVVENLADQPLGEDVLDQHLIDGGLRDVRVEARLAELEEVGERLLELRVVPVGLLDLLGQRLGQVGDALLELLDGLLELLDLRLDVAKNSLSRSAELLRVRHVERSSCSPPFW